MAVIVELWWFSNCHISDINSPLEEMHVLNFKILEQTPCFHSSACCNFDVRKPLLIIFGRNVTGTGNNALFFLPHLTSASALPGKTKI